MGDIAAVFDDSIKGLRNYPAAIVPAFVAMIVPFLLLVLVLSLAGVIPVVQQLVSLKQSYDEQRVTSMLHNNSTTFGEYATAHGFDIKNVLAVFTPTNVLLFVVLVVVWIILSLYLSSVMFAILALLSNRKKPTAATVHRLANSVFFRYVLYQLFMFVLMTVPMILCVMLVALCMMFSPLLGILAIFLLGLIFICYFIFIRFRVFYGVASLFIDDVGVLEAVRRSFALSRKKIVPTILLFIISAAISYFSSTLINQPMMGALGQLVLMNGIGAALNGALGIVLMVVSAAVMTFSLSIIFNGYVEMKRA